MFFIDLEFPSTNAKYSRVGRAQVALVDSTQ